MDEVIPVSESDFPLESPAPAKSWPLVAWGFIILMAGAIGWLQSLRSEKRAADTEDRAGLLMMQMQARSIVGVAELFSIPMGRTENQTQFKALNTGSVSRRLRAIIVQGEIDGPQKAQDLLKDLDQKIDSNQVRLADSERRLKQVLARLYVDYAKEKFEAPSLQSSDQDYLRQELGWFGDLALAPAQGSDHEARERVLAPATRTAIIMIGAIGLGLLAAAAGLFGMIFLVIFFYTGQVRLRFRRGIGCGGLYAETFAIWMALFLALQFVVGLVHTEKYRFPLLGLAMLVSLITLGWPVLRGVPWRQVREDIGFTNGRWPILEPFFGLAGYAMTLPMLLVAVLFMIGFMGLRDSLSPITPENNFGPINQPSHPIVEYLLTGNWWSCVQLVVMASILAPLVEETMFRGVLYRHLREASAGLGITLSVILSGMVVSFVFAVVHPQGLLAVPPLMALAFGFALLREWRGTLIPSMVAHGLNNGLVTLVLILVAS
jgi:membrane protease YdiL (CAAX protease family)